MPALGSGSRIGVCCQCQQEARREQIVLSSTHTHSGPVLRDNLVDIYPMGPDGWKQIERYSDWLQPRIVQAVSEAMAALAPAQLAQGIGQRTFLGSLVG